MLSVAVIGSSGGGVATMGHTDMTALLQAIDLQLQKVCRLNDDCTTGSSASGADSTADRGSGGGGGGACLMYALMVALDNGQKGMDGANETTDPAALYIVERTITNSDNNNKNNSISPFHCKTMVKGWTLKEVNQVCSKIQQDFIATRIHNGEINGLICISCHADIFQETLLAAAHMQIPVTGSGGTSLAQIASLYGIRLSGNAGGSVATTSLTRAISYTHALSKSWKLNYQPWLDNNTNHTIDSSSSSSSSNGTSDGTLQQQQHGPAWTSILNASLPAFWAASLTKRVLLMIVHWLDHHQQHDHDEVAASSFLLGTFQVIVGIDQQHSCLLMLQQVLESTIYALEHFVLPMVCSVVMATSSSHQHKQQQQKQQLDNNNNTQQQQQQEQRPFSSLIMAAVLASVTCYDSCLAGLVAGYLVSKWSLRLLYLCIFSNIPATMTNLLTAGGIGGIVAIIMLPMAIILRQFSTILRWCIHWTVTITISQQQQQQQQQPHHVSVMDLIFTRQTLAAFTWGCWSCYGSKVGWYHSIHLPLILLEMEHQANASFLGAIDELTLVLVCAGICAGNLVIATAPTPTKTIMTTSTNNTGRRPNTMHSSSIKTLTEADVALCKRGLSINLSCGDFVEVCYPYMEESVWINLGEYLASGLSSVWLVIRSSIFSHHHHEPFEEDTKHDGTAAPLVLLPPQSLAYLPWPIAIWLAGPHWRPMAEASFIAFGVSFSFTLLARFLSLKRR